MHGLLVALLGQVHDHGGCCRFRFLRDHHFFCTHRRLVVPGSLGDSGNVGSGSVLSVHLVL